MQIEIRSSIILYIVVALSALGCTSKTEQTTATEVPTTDSLVAVDALYFNFLTTNEGDNNSPILALNIPSFADKDYRGVLDAKIDRPTVVAEIQQLVASLTPNDYSEGTLVYNPRIILYLSYNSGLMDSLSIGNDEHLDQIYLNNKLQKENTRLLYLVKNNIGLYPWLIGKGLELQNELYDPSFMKEPFIQSNYYKIYSENN